MAAKTSLKTREKSGRITVTRTFTLYPNQEQKLISAEANRKAKDPRASISSILQELIDSSLDVSTGRAREYLTARDRAMDFEEDVVALLADAGIDVKRSAKVLTSNGERSHRADFLITGKRGSCIVELKSSGKRDRLELALGQSLILGRESGLPVAVCVPVILDPELKRVFEIAHVALVEAGDLIPWIKSVVG